MKKLKKIKYDEKEIKLLISLLERLWSLTKIEKETGIKRWVVYAIRKENKFPEMPNEYRERIISLTNYRRDNG